MLSEIQNCNRTQEIKSRFFHVRETIDKDFHKINIRKMNIKTREIKGMKIFKKPSE